MLTSRINFRNFKLKKKSNFKSKLIFREIIKNKNSIIESLSENYKDRLINLVSKLTQFDGLLPM